MALFAIAALVGVPLALLVVDTVRALTREG